MDNPYMRIADNIVEALRTGRENGIMPCPSCGVRSSQDCGYGVWERGDFDCEAPDIDGEPCEYCHHLYCDECKLQEAMEFKSEEFDIEE